MSNAVELLRARARPRAVALTMIGLGLAGCSESTRFTDNQAVPGGVTGSVMPAPMGRVESNQLPPPSVPRPSPVAAAPVPPPSYGTQTAYGAPPAYGAQPTYGAQPSYGAQPTYSAQPSYNTQPSYSAQPTYAAPVASVQPARATPGIAGGGRGMASYTPGSASVPGEATGSVPPAAAAPRPPQASPAPAPAPQLSWSGSSAVTVAHGETVQSIARRHGVSAASIIAANKLAPRAVIYPGQRLVIPGARQATPAPAPVAQAPRVAATLPVKPTPAPAKPIVVASAVPGTPVTAPVPAAAAPQQPAQAGVHTVAAGDTLAKISKKHHKPLMAILKANNLPPNARLKIGDRIVIPGAQASLAVKEVGKDAAKDMQPKAPAAASAPAAAPAGAPGSKTPAKQASAEPAQTAAVVTPVNEPMPVAAHGKDGSTATFRWPVKGRVIAGFGPRPNGQQNDGINLAVPEGTPVKAAEDGVVTYAGSELKGYGNLVLVRHPNGYVTAYAHAKELLVKRGDSIKRGQTIANSGQTGNVDAPQLHFEIRKGPAPQDPLPMLAGG